MASVSGPLGSRHFPEATNPVSAPQNSPKVSGGTQGVGQIKWKCHQDWAQGSLSRGIKTPASASARALWRPPAPGRWRGARPSWLTGQLGVWQGGDCPRQSPRVVILGLGGGARNEGLRLMQKSSRVTSTCSSLCRTSAKRVKLCLSPPSSPRIPLTARTLQISPTQGLGGSPGSMSSKLTL